MPRRAEGRKTEGGKRYFVGPDSGLNKKTDYSRSNQNDKFGQWRAWQNKSSELMLLCLAEVDPPFRTGFLLTDHVTVCLGCRSDEFLRLEGCVAV